ncbi:aconitase X catalytic domain-containing protein [Halodesulfurarchaeum sp. HSR-GB]|uniref:aconitase X catalytic domain-containing protein n=1 Tax=Halodesulfurarchaeum sp. HSR-GB TaxID=3074077 RepID=UPI002862872D|nr:aconitase X catalytic domain-containing protein [Halodesulfurarchaeum sp. HSR-GB]MDR5657184.1 aconitase X catalytic domain-containing protein [Halodesulfurarchaeum sp. HSR-GB]
MPIDLTTDEQALLESDNPAVRKSMELLVRLGDIYGAEEFVEIGSAQASGISYKSIGDPGVEFLEGFAAEGAEVEVQTFANPAGMDIDRWEEMGVDPEFAKQQRRIVGALREMGVTVSFTCTPYLAGNLPGPNEHIAWAESSAVSFANSVVGARTNREGGPSALAAAITGRTPKYGLHLAENRVPTHRIDVDVELQNQADFAALGSWAGRIVEDGRPYFAGVDGATTDELKALGAAMAATGAVAMHFVGGVTTDEEPPTDLETLQFGSTELDAEYGELNSTGDTDLIVFGCPHASVDEIGQVADRLDGESLDRDLWVCASGAVKSQADRMGYTETIEDAGGMVLSDTCNVVAPIEEMGYESTATDSAKAAAYLPGFGEQDVHFDDKLSLLEEAIE